LSLYESWTLKLLHIAILGIRPIDNEDSSFLRAKANHAVWSKLDGCDVVDHLSVVDVREESIVKVSNDKIGSHSIGQLLFSI